MKRAELTSQGFTLIEIIVILAVISILAAILTPTVLRYISDAQVTRAEEDVKNISAVLNDLVRDTGKFPGNLADANFLCGPGDIANKDTTSWVTARKGAKGTSCTLTANTGVFADSLSDHLLANDPNEDGTADGSGDYPPVTSTGKFKWKGPYVPVVNQDPWGNAYEVNVSTFTGGDTNPTWVISAGPDGKFQTPTTATTLSGDDVGVRIK